MNDKYPIKNINIEEIDNAPTRDKKHQINENLSTEYDTGVYKDNKLQGYKVKGHKHLNPYSPADDEEKYYAFEDAWQETKSTWNSVKGIFKKYQQERIDRVKERVEHWSNPETRKEFMNSEELRLHTNYIKELEGDHLYPKKLAKGTGQPVLYLDSERDKQEMRVTIDKSSIKNEKGIRNTQAESGYTAFDDLAHKTIIFTRRQSDGNQLKTMIKLDQNRNPTKQSDQPLGPEEKRTQHSTTTAGKDVINAGKLKVNKDGDITAILMSSGHYAPNRESALKMKMWGEATGTLANNIKILDHSGKDTLNLHHRGYEITTVGKWAIARDKKK